MDRDPEFLLLLTHERMRRARQHAELHRFATEAKRHAPGWRLRMGERLVRLGGWIAGVPAATVHAPTPASRPTPC